MKLERYHKQIAPLVTLMVVVVGFIAVHSSSRQIEAEKAALHRKAEAYGVIMASSTASAVAFSDRETAREVLHALAADPDIESVTLFGDQGQRLFSRGTQEVDIVGTSSAKVVDTEHRLAVVRPVTSLEGPAGLLVLELSKRRLQVARENAIYAAAITGGLALVCGALVAWLIARRIASRLRALVAERTAQLDQRTAEMQLVFDHVEQGFLIVDRAGELARERSAVVERWLGPIANGMRFADYVGVFAPDHAPWVELQWQLLQDGELPPELCLAQLPARLQVGACHLELAYSTITDTRGDLRVLVVITDVTAKIEAERAERDERELTALLGRLLRGRAGFRSFLDEASEYIASLRKREHLSTPRVRRTVHTLKGVCALEGLASIAELCHALETALDEQDEARSDQLRQTIIGRWELLTGKLAPLLGATEEYVDVIAEDLARLEGAIARRAGWAELSGIVAEWRRERVVTHLERLADDARTVASLLGKDPIDVQVEADPSLRLPDRRCAAFWSAAIHAIRNAVDHGVEAPAERVRLGKPRSGRLQLRARRTRDAITIEFEDDGRGIDWAQLAEIAGARGMATSSESDLLVALFADGVSTRGTVTTTSGRGVGLSALRHACESSGGRISVVSTPGSGTRLSCTWPLHLVIPEPPGGLRALPESAAS